MVVPLAAAHQRAGLVSLLYVVSYLGLGVPAVLAGFGVVHGGGLIPTTRDYGARGDRPGRAGPVRPLERRRPRRGPAAARHQRVR